MDQVMTYVPDGLLPRWLLIISAVSIANSVQTYSTLKFTQRVYSGPNGNDSPVTPLSSRTFGTWTFITSIVRLYAAYNINNPEIYQLAFATFAVAFGHFVSEWLVFRSTNFGAGLLGPLCVSTGTLVWMSMQWDYYVE